MNIVILGLSITSSWGNGHATTYRGLVRELERRGHSVLFLERDVPWYRDNADLPEPPFGRTELYSDRSDLEARFAAVVERAEFVIVGSYVPEGTDVGRWVQQTAAGITAFYDIDTPVTIAQLERGECEYLALDLIPGYDLYLSFTGGPMLTRLEEEFGALRARPLYCSVDTELYYPDASDSAYDLGYLGTYSTDRQPTLERLMLEPARCLPANRFVVAGPQYPDTIRWPENVERIEHLSPAYHRSFYNRQRFTLNVTRADMVRAGYAPSVRLFEAAACAVPVISDYWPGLETFFKPEREILISRSPDETVEILRDMSEQERRTIGRRALSRVLESHTAARRAAELEGYLEEVVAPRVSPENAL